jgi:hypothetical protein
MIVRAAFKRATLARLALPRHIDFVSLASGGMETI